MQMASSEKSTSKKSTNKKVGAKIVKKSSEEKKSTENDDESPKVKFNKVDPKTIDLCENIIQHVNSTLSFLTCENSTLQQ